MRLSAGYRPSAEAPCDLIAVHETVGFARVVHLFDKVDFCNAAELTEELRALSSGAPLVIDASKCRYIDAAGVRALIAARNGHRGGFAVVASVDGAIARVFRELRVHRTLPVCSSLRDALAHALMTRAAHRRFRLSVQHGASFAFNQRESRSG